MAADTISNHKPYNQKGKSFTKQRDEWTYSFKDKQISTIFHLLNKRGMLKFLENWRLDEAETTNDPRYCLYNRNIGHPTKECYIYKHKIQA